MADPIYITLNNKLVKHTTNSYIEFLQESTVKTINVIFICYKKFRMLVIVMNFTFQKSKYIKRYVRFLEYFYMLCKKLSIKVTYLMLLFFGDYNYFCIVVLLNVMGTIFLYCKFVTTK